jgi:hypothetical protein
MVSDKIHMMKFEITCRCDQEEYFCTDTWEEDVETWENLLKIIKEVENRNTVLEIKRIDIL